MSKMLFPENHDIFHLDNNKIYVMCCEIWYQSVFGVCMVVQTHANAC